MQTVVVKLSPISSYRWVGKVYREVDFSREHRAFGPYKLRESRLCQWSRGEW